MTTKQTAEAAYAAKYAELLARLETLRQLVEDMPAPSERTHLGHVGSAALVAQRLDDAARAAKM